MGGKKTTLDRFPAWVIAVVLVIVGMGIVSVGGLLSETSTHPLDDLLIALGSGFTVAGVLALVVDSNLKRRIATEAAESTSSVFFNQLLGGGRRLPDEYFAGMHELAVADILTLQIDWVLEFEWASGNRYLKLRVNSEHTSINFSGFEKSVADRWIMQYPDGRPSSYFESCEFDLIVPDPDQGRVPKISHQSLSRDTLSNITRNEEFGQRLPLSEHPKMNMKANATRVIRVTGVAFHDTCGVFPLMCSQPTLKQSVTIIGDALDDLQVKIYGDVYSDTERKAGEVYEVGFGVRGTSIRIHWCLKRDRQNANQPGIES